jgi:hypothetical protein
MAREVPSGTQDGIACTIASGFGSTNKAIE